MPSFYYPFINLLHNLVCLRFGLMECEWWQESIIYQWIGLMWLAWRKVMLGVTCTKGKVVPANSGGLRSVTIKRRWQLIRAMKIQTHDCGLRGRGNGVTTNYYKFQFNNHKFVATLNSPPTIARPSDTGTQLITGFLGEIRWSWGIGRELRLVGPLMGLCVRVEW